MLMTTDISSAWEIAITGREVSLSLSSPLYSSLLALSWSVYHPISTAPSSTHYYFHTPTDYIFLTDYLLGTFLIFPVSFSPSPLFLNPFAAFLFKEYYQWCLLTYTSLHKDCSQKSFFQSLFLILKKSFFYNFAVFQFFLFKILLKYRYILFVRGFY